MSQGAATEGTASGRDRLSLPLHQRIRADIEARILSGTWPPGYRIPFEHEFMAEYGCARMTVNKALSALAETGLIERRRRAGSFVSRPRVQSAVLEIHDIQAEIQQRGQDYRFELTQRLSHPAGPAEAALLGVAPGTAVLTLTCRHFANGRPFAIEDRHINLTQVPEAETIDFAVEPPGTWLLHHVPWNEAEHRISAINADTALAGALDIDTGTACLVVTRQTWRSGETITHVVTRFPGELYDLVARFAPSSS